jgi:hypothetical protein
VYSETWLVIWGSQTALPGPVEPIPFFVCVPHKMKQIYWLYYMLQRSSTSVNCWSSLLHAADTIQLRCLSLCRHELGQITNSGYTRCGKETKTEWIKFKLPNNIVYTSGDAKWTQILWAANDMKLEPSRLVEVLNLWYVFEICQVRILARTPITVNAVFRNFLSSSRKIMG